MALLKILPHLMGELLIMVGVYVFGVMYMLSYGQLIAPIFVMITGGILLNGLIVRNALLKYKKNLLTLGLFHFIWVFPFILLIIIVILSMVIISGGLPH